MASLSNAARKIFAYAVAPVALSAAFAMGANAQSGPTMGKPVAPASSTALPGGTNDNGSSATPTVKEAARAALKDALIDSKTYPGVVVFVGLGSEPKTHPQTGKKLTAQDYCDLLVSKLKEAGVRAKAVAFERTDPEFPAVRIAFIVNEDIVGDVLHAGNALQAIPTVRDRAVATWGEGAKAAPPASATGPLAQVPRL